MTGGHNKTGNTHHIAKKLAANIPYIIGNLCSKFGDNWFMSGLLGIPEREFPGITEFSAGISRNFKNLKI